MSRVKLSTQRLNLNTICSNPVTQTFHSWPACGLAGLVIPILSSKTCFLVDVLTRDIVLNLIAGLFGHQKGDIHST